MRFSRKAVFVGLSTLLSFATVSNAAGECMAGPYAPKSAVGRDDLTGTPTFCWAEYDVGLIVVGIEVFAIRWHIKGIKLTLSDETTRMLGKAETDSEGGTGRIKWAYKERVVSMKMWKNKSKDALGKIQMEMSDGQKLDVGNTKESTGDGPVTVDIGGGTILGAMGANGDFLDSLTWLFLKNPIKEAEYSEIQFEQNMEDWNAEQTGMDTQTVGISYIVNDFPLGTPNGTFGFTNSRKIQQGKTLTSESRHIVGAEIGVKVTGGVEIPLLAKAQVETHVTAKYEYQKMDGVTTTDMVEDALVWEFKGSLAPQTAAICRAIATNGKFDSKYTATTTVTMADGTNFKMYIKGSVLSVGWTQATSRCGGIAIADVPGGEDTRKVNEPVTARAVKFIS